MNKFDLNTIANDLGLAEVNQLIDRCLDSEASRISEIARYSFEQKGKQIRPILTLLIARFCGLKSITPELLNIAAGVELIHLATILHDDIIDRSELRRNQVSAYKKYGTNDTIITGDFLLVKAFGLCGLLDKEIVRATEVACSDLTEGEILETPLHESEHSLETSLLIAKKKTAALFRLASFSAAKIAGCSEETCRLLSEFGENLGISFQILDDILDVSANVAQFGKELGTDLRERKPSVVNILWLATNTELAKQLKLKPEQAELDIDAHLSAIRCGGTLELSQNLAENYVKQSDLLLDQTSAQLPNHCAESKAILKALTNYILIRSK